MILLYRNLNIVDLNLLQVTQINCCIIHKDNKKLICFPHTHVILLTFDIMYGVGNLNAGHTGFVKTRQWRKGN
jgi:hypothetical protein